MLEKGPLRPLRAETDRIGRVPSNYGAGPGGLPQADQRAARPVHCPSALLLSTLDHMESSRATSGAAPASSSPDLRQRLSDAGTDALGRMTDLTHSLTDQAARLADESRQYVREQPAPTLGGAFAVGLAVGVLLGLR
jgi:ElaB/YqjD/DUF883 family membrane-anchored ribosome-binding protein